MNINYHGNLFIPISEINKLRRDLLAKLENNLVNSYKHEIKSIKLDKKEKIEENKSPTLSVYTNNLNHLKELENVERVYLEIPADTSSQLDKINISYMVNFLEKALEISANKDYELKAVTIKYYKDAECKQEVVVTNWDEMDDVKCYYSNVSPSKKFMIFNFRTIN